VSFTLARAVFNDAKIPVSLDKTGIRFLVNIPEISDQQVKDLRQTALRLLGTVTKGKIGTR